MNFSIFAIDKSNIIPKEFKKIGVDKYGIKIMRPKASMQLLKIKYLSNITANILKQEMLSLGGDVAIARDALTGRIKETDCLVMGNLLQISRLIEKLRRQPFGLSLVGSEIKRVLDDYNRNNFVINLGRFRLNIGKRTLIMGIVNLTPDSFSGDGLYGGLQITDYRLQIENMIKHVEKMVKDGADIVDIGGESTRPGAKPVSVKEELHRTIPVIKILAKRIKVPISIDTYKPEVARQALDNGAVIVNDTTGLRNPKMRKVVSKYKCGVVIMHMQGAPRTMQNNPIYESLIDEIIEYLGKAIKLAIESGIDKEKIIIDPGIGFGKTLEHNLEILRRLREFKSLGRPVLVGPSRKSFIGKILNFPPQERIIGTGAAVSLAIANGAHIVRVHDVKEISQVIKICDSIIGN